MNIVVHGLAVGLSLIIAIGPQNALLLKQGIKRTGVTAVVLVCLISDIILILGGTAGVGVLIDKAPIVLSILKWAGVAYLSYFAFTCFRDAFTRSSAAVVEQQDPAPGNPQRHPGTAGTHNGPPASGTAVATAVRDKAPATAHWKQPVLAAVVMTWLNPGTYVDVVVMLGGMANQYGESGRWLFATGAIAASTIWFPSIGYGAAALAKPLSNPTVNKWVNVGIGVTMVLIAARLILH
ncbi:LysE/ArgO family amino acid transporter [Corynebacterium mendelii]|uniref:Amino acid transporter n=1 Tax=Corynebacterium mendelii TaxID=2765362 RepID=A0A939E118_9CORY|nr:LysE/ArgO family amino acid transporter [Corynebacterium mendelii]MBN9644994.1 amino acid transporter [Corynebacterium mendelii]